MLSVLLLIITLITQTFGLNVGVGKYDITGPTGGINMMGYAMIQQVNSGLHTRLYSRAFIFKEQGKTVVYVSIDSAMTTFAIKKRALDLLCKKLAEDAEVSSGDAAAAAFVCPYNNDNVLISATHTHSSPAGFHEYLLYGITSLGFIRPAYESICYGVYQSLYLAHSDLKQSQLYFDEERVGAGSINRSPTAYLMNPEQERKLYDRDVDDLMQVLSIHRENLRGLISWFPVHCVSVNNSNSLTSADNKGYASYLFEHSQSQVPYTAGKSSVVAAFGQAHEGDVTPNTEGSYCLDTGKPCMGSCVSGGVLRNHLCTSRGPGWNVSLYESSRVIGSIQYHAAKQLLKGKKVPDQVDFRHAFIDMTNIQLPDGNTCPAARGYSFAAGTTDGPGGFADFLQGTNSSTIRNPIWQLVGGLISRPDKKQTECHYPKPILLNTGQVRGPYPWEPSVVSIQVIRVGDIFILGVPAEFTTMAGRRLKRAAQCELEKKGLWKQDDENTAGSRIVIAGLSNMYSGYVTTPEEYIAQRYEGASTIYGPRTLDAYIQEFRRLFETFDGNDQSQKVNDELCSFNAEIPVQAHNPKEEPLDFMDKLISLLPPLLIDVPIPGLNFGAVLQQPQQMYNIGDTVSVKFLTGHPRANVRDVTTQLESSFFYIEKWQDDKWVVVRDDNDFDTFMEWSKAVPVLPGVSTALVSWRISKTPLVDSVNPAIYPTTPHYTEKTNAAIYGDIEKVEGKYRIRYRASHVIGGGLVASHEGLSETFEVLPELKLVRE
jgi:neutral ceramidase